MQIDTRLTSEYKSTPTRFKKNEFTIYPHLVLFLTALAVLLPACSKESLAFIESKVEKPVISAPRPVNFVLCIDNSRSILPPEQILIRETTMLVADLADNGDRIDVITFGKGATLAASTHIRSDADRIAFKNQLRRGVDFQENYSDLRAAVRFLGDAGQSPLAREGFTPCVVLLSDGKLEPADKNTRQAFNEMAETLRTALSEVNIYAVVLGDTYCNDVILKDVDGSDLDGKTLMRKYIARSKGHFFHAAKMDQLLEIAVGILGRAKGITSLGEKANASQFRIDDSVESMTLIVRKRTTDGKSLFDSSDIVVNKPEGGLERQGESMYRSSDYRYFDLIVVRNPREGMWFVALANGERPEVLSKIVTPLELRCDLRDRYYLNEASVVRAWIFNNRSGEVVAGRPFIVKAHLAKDGGLQESNVYAEFHRDSDTGQYYLEVPREVLRTLKVDENPTEVTVEVVAQRFKQERDTIDPWFARRSSPVGISLVDPFCAWVLREPRILKIPIIGKLLHWVFAVPTVDAALPFGATVDPKGSYYPPFDGPPRLKFVVERFDTEAQAFRPLIEKTLDGAAEGGKIVYTSSEVIRDAGRYRYAYSLDGVVKNEGHFGIKSPNYAFEIQSHTVATWAFLLVVSVFIVNRAASLGAKLQGDLSIRTYEGDKLVKSYDEQIGQKRYEADTFSIYAQRSILFKPKIVFKSKAKASAIIIDAENKQGSKQRLEPGEHRIEVKDNGEQTIIQVDLYV